jgi:hypothetical protein
MCKKGNVKVKHIGMLIHAMLYLALLIYTIIYLQREVVDVQATPLETLQVYVYLQSQQDYVFDSICVRLHDDPSVVSATTTNECFCPQISRDCIKGNRCEPTNQQTHLVVYNCTVKNGDRILRQLCNNGSQVPTCLNTVTFFSLSFVNITSSLLKQGWNGNVQEYSIFLPFDKIFGYIYNPGCLDWVNCGTYSRVSFLDKTITNKLISYQIKDVELQSFQGVDEGHIMSWLVYKFFLGHKITSTTKIEYGWNELVYPSCLLCVALVEVVYFLYLNCNASCKKAASNLKQVQSAERLENMVSNNEADLLLKE